MSQILQSLSPFYRWGLSTCKGGPPRQQDGSICFLSQWEFLGCKRPAVIMPKCGHLLPISDAQQEHNRCSGSTKQPTVLKGLLPGFQDRVLWMERRDLIPVLALTWHLQTQTVGSLLGT